ncbi:hypothetical protein M409DRAFT_70320 [Zasmidium cellare ATCC 36951]|uniref:FAD dependent oxidoreductase domain-containing protein n=1 Tax=Zasmidium cellare ATCC 36951 TaxID=1080233 RepID=A0A6A6C0I6_ZASCE|nr:uncharacterized protein M409DRAFT_70320 [Zasmidium cellare ATCC 36951]KAF2160564.1 hypothetical protein M409DRAFT_70320 [Zasmidium cellare ATCC 36951]
MTTLPISGILLEAEEFQDYGGWTMDSQFSLEMGSPYLLAHGNGVPVADAVTTSYIPLPDQGDYHIWIRAKDWVPGHHPGRFQVTIDDTTLETVFGANDRDWSWEYGGKVEMPPGEFTVRLHDLTGFGSRCDEIFLSQDTVPPPEFVEPVKDIEQDWRRGMRRIPREPVLGGEFDVIVVGGGLVGCVAAVTAARLGERVAVVQDRPKLGLRGPLVEEMVKRGEDGDIHAREILEGMENVELWMEHTVFNTISKRSKILSIDVRDARTGRETRLSAPNYIDCSGKCILGLLCGAETMSGREPRAKYNESLAPRRGDNFHHGNTVFFRTSMADSPVPFPTDIPWATEVAKDYANLGGQLITPGTENGPGPTIDEKPHSHSPIARMQIPCTHFWEYGQWLDPYTQGETIRDHLWRAIYGTLANIKSHSTEYADLHLEHVAFVAGQGAFNRYRGDYILSEPDIRSHRPFPDAVVQNVSQFCLHYPGDTKYDFRLQHWTYDERDGSPYEIPFRSLYSCNVENLLFAGKHISTTHIAGASTKHMGCGSQHGIAVGVAAALARKYKISPRELGRKHMRELQRLVGTVTGTDIGEKTAGKVERAKL